MTIEQRLHHAARELRAVPIDVPELACARPTRRLRRVPALVAPVLFAIGGAVAVTGALGSGTQGHHGSIERDFVGRADAATAAPAPGASQPGSAGPIGGELIVPSNDPSADASGSWTVRSEQELIADLVLRGAAEGRSNRPSVAGAETDVAGPS